MQNDFSEKEMFETYFKILKRTTPAVGTNLDSNVKNRAMKKSSGPRLKVRTSKQDEGFLLMATRLKKRRKKKSRKLEIGENTKTSLVADF